MPLDPNALVNVGVAILPEVLALFRSRHAAADPNAPTPTDAEVLAGLKAAVEQSIATDNDWLARHPAQP